MGVEKKSEKDRLKGGGGIGSEGALGKKEIKLGANCKAVNERKRRGRKEIRNFLQEKLCKSLSLDSTRKEREF